MRCAVGYFHSCDASSDKTFLASRHSLIEVHSRFTVFSNEPYPSLSGIPHYQDVSLTMVHAPKGDVLYVYSTGVEKAGGVPKANRPRRQLNVNDE